MFSFLSRGDLEIVLEKFQFSPGDSVNGKVTLKLKKPIQADKIVVSVTGEKIYTNRSGARVGTALGGTFSVGVGSGNNDLAQTSIDKIFYFELPLDGSKEYSEGEYPFSIKLPADVVQQQNQNPNDLEGGLATISKVLGEVNSMTSRMIERTEWFVEARLDIPKSIDMRKKVLINVA